MKISTIGIDLGNANVKTSNRVIFESRVKPEITSMNENDIKVKYDGIEYTVGSYDGALNIRKNKHKKKAYKVSLLTAIALSYKSNFINCNVVVGVPVEDYNDVDFTEDIKKTISNYNEVEEITVNGVVKKIKIENVEVFCESGIVFSNRERFENEKTLVIDFGGSTIDVSFWDGLRLSKSRTYKEGMITLYENIIKRVNDEFGTKLNSNLASDMIGKTEYEIDQEVKNIKFIDSVVENYVDGLTSYINQYFPAESANSIQLIGGGAIQLAKLLKDEYDKSNLVEDAEYANADNYAKVGELLWN
ncbi:TPA: hypothetical protein ACOTG0_002124 [Clostridium perfringens]|nr:ParM [Clostridium phage phiCp-D]